MEIKNQDYQEDYLFQLIGEIEDKINQGYKVDLDNLREQSVIPKEKEAFHISIFLYDKRYDSLILRASTLADYHLGREGTPKNYDPKKIASMSREELKRWLREDENRPGISVSASLLGETISIPNVKKKSDDNSKFYIPDNRKRYCEFPDKELGGIHVIPLKTTDEKFGGIKVLTSNGQKQMEYTFAIIRIATFKGFEITKAFINDNFDKRWNQGVSNTIRNTFSLSALIAIGSDVNIKSLCKLATKTLSTALGAKGCSIFLADNYDNDEMLGIEIRAEYSPKEKKALKKDFIKKSIIYRCFGTTGLVKPNEWNVYKKLEEPHSEFYDYKLIYELPNINDRLLDISMTCGVIRSRQNAFIDDIHSSEAIKSQFSSEYKINRKPGHGKACEHYVKHHEYYHSGSLMFLPLFYREPDSRATEVLGVIRVLRPKLERIVGKGLQISEDLKKILLYNPETGSLSFIKKPSEENKNMVMNQFNEENDKKKIEELYNDWSPGTNDVAKTDINFEVFDSRAKHFFVSYVEKIAQLIANARLNDFLKSLPSKNDLEDIYDHIMWIIPRIIGGSDFAILTFDEEEKCLWNVREWRTIKLDFQKEDLMDIGDDKIFEKFKNNETIDIETGVYLNYPKLEESEKGIKEYDLSAVWDKRHNQLSEEDLEKIGYTGWFALRWFALKKPEEGIIFNSQDELEKLRRRFNKDYEDLDLPKHRKWKVKRSPSREKYFNELAYEDTTARFLACPIFSIHSTKSMNSTSNNGNRKLFGMIRVCKGLHHTPFTENDLRLLRQIVNQVEVVIYRILQEQMEKNERKKRYHRYFPEVIKESLSEELDNLWENKTEIEKTIIDQVKELWKKYGEIWGIKSDDMKEIIEQFAVIDDKVLKSIMPHYRDHLIHQCVVFTIGNEIIYQLNKQANNERIREDIQFDKLCRNAYGWESWDKEYVEASWFLAANFHDVGYPIEKVNIWIKGIINKFFKGIDEPLEKIDVHRLIQSIQSLNDAYNDVVEYHAAFNYDHKQSVDNLFSKLLITGNDHAIISATILQSMKRLTAFDSRYLKPISSAIAIHNQMMKQRHINMLNFDQHPLGFLLVYCDLLHEWGRINFEKADSIPGTYEEDHLQDTKLDTLWFGIYFPGKVSTDEDGRLVDLGKESCRLEEKLKCDVMKLLKTLDIKTSTIIVYSNLNINDLAIFDMKRKEIENHFRILCSNNPIFIIQLSGDCIYSTYKKCPVKIL